MARTTSNSDDGSADESPEGWYLIDDDPGLNRLRVWRRGRDGLVLAVEERSHRSQYVAVVLPENYQDDNVPIRRYGDRGVVEESDDLDRLLPMAREWMQFNRR